MKKSVAIIITLLLMILPMIAVPVQATSLQIVQIGTVNNLKSELKGNTVYFTWDQVTSAEGYDVYINTANQGYQYIGSVNSNTAPVIGFQQGVNYLAKVCAYKMDSNGTKQVGGFSNEVVVSITPQVSLAAVNSLTVSQNNGNITLNWSKISNATGYQIFVNLPSFGYVNLGSVDGMTNAIITGGQNNTTYSFKVRAYQQASSGELLYGEFSPEKTITINANQNDNKPENNKPEETKPDKVQGLRVNSISENMVDISWQVSNYARGYEIYLATANGSYQYIDTVYKNSATLKNLNYDTAYKVKVIPFRDGNNGAVYGEESQELNFITDKQKIEVGRAENVSTKVDKNKAYLTWTNAQNADGYEIWLTDSRTPYTCIDTVYRNSANIYNLQYNTTYSVIIVAFKNVNGTRQYGPDSKAVRFYTEEDLIVGQVKSVTVDAKTTSAAVIWKKAENADGYEIYLSQNNRNNYRYVDDTQNLVTSLVNLQQNTTYYVKVIPYRYANGMKKYGKESAPTSFVTLKQETTPIVTGFDIKVGKEKVNLKWNPVQGAAKYEIELYVPWVGNVTLTEYGTSREITGLTKGSKYTVKVRAYKWINGQLVPGNYSVTKEFIAK